MLLADAANDGRRRERSFFLVYIPQDDRYFFIHFLLLNQTCELEPFIFFCPSPSPNISKLYDVIRGYAKKFLNIFFHSRFTNNVNLMYASGSAYADITKDMEGANFLVCNKFTGKR